MPSRLAQAEIPNPAFSAKERRLVARLRTPEAVQRWLNTLPYNWEPRGPTARTFRGVVRTGKAHCLEAALTAATILEQRGYRPLLLDIESTDHLDHVLFLYQADDGRWGTVARSRCPGLNGRKPVFRNLPALVRSYVAPYIDETGRVKGYGVLDLRRLRGRWRLHQGNVRFVERALIDNSHRKLLTHEATFRKWKQRFDSWHKARGHPKHEWPVFADYPLRRTWSALPAKRRL